MAFLQWLIHGAGRSVDELAARVGIPAAELLAVKPAYHTFQVPKRRGGQRTIHAPDVSLKRIQRSVYRRLLKRLPVHPSVAGFRPGYSIASNAAVHVGQTLVLRLDIQDFFPATQARRIHRYFRKIGWNRTAATLLTRLCTWEGGLPQGAPTSPQLSNIVNYQMDTRLAGLAAWCGGVYTRYADDLTFSFALDVHRHYSTVLSMVPGILARYGYAIHTGKKMQIRRRHQCQMVTGLVVNEKLALPRKTRRWLRAVDHRLANGANATLSLEQRAGWAGLEAMVHAQTRAMEGVDPHPIARHQRRNPKTGEVLP